MGSSGGGGDMGFFNPVGALGHELGADDTFMYLNDPLDLMGYRAAGTQEEVAKYAMGSAQKSIQAQQEMLDKYNALYGPYREAAVGGWGDFTANALGGQGANVPMSPQYQLEMDRNNQAINRGV